LKRKIRNIAAAAAGIGLILFGFVKRAKEQIRKNGYIAGIYFHNPGKALFEKCVRWLLDNGFTVIDTKELAEILSKKKQPPPMAVWLSLDDGWKENMRKVVPYAAENKIPLTFFIPTEVIENSGVYWWSIAEKYQKLLPLPYCGDINKLWQIPESERGKIISGLRVKIEDELPREAMTIDDIKKIAEYEYFTIGSHTVNHVITPNCTDDELDYELSESKKKLEEWTGKDVDFFCYPNGDYSERDEKILQKNGYKFAAAAENKFITGDTKPYCITRFSVGDGYFYEELCHMLGVWQKAMNKFKG
jgi:peptidoglycan/xylan/chitin deacetylase (PgdA/CDA1 family)